MRSHGKVLGLVPEPLWNERDEYFLMSMVFGIGWTLYFRSAPRHPLQALLVAALIVWRWLARRGG